MKKETLKSQLMLWIAIIFSFMAIFYGPLAIIPFLLLIIILIRFVPVKKKLLHEVNTLEDLYIKKEEVENEINNSIHKHQMYLKEAENEKRETEHSLKYERNQLEITLETIKKEIESKKQEQIAIKELVDNDMRNYNYQIIFPYDFETTDSDELNANLHKLNLKEKELLVDKSKFVQKTLNEDLTVTYRNNQYKQIIRLFNAETSLIIKAITPKNYESSMKKLFTLYTQINKIFDLDGVSIPKQLLDMKIERLTMMKDYELKREDEKIIRREERERIKEEEQAKKEMNRKLKDLDKDIRHHDNEVAKLTKYLQKAQLDAEKELYIEKIKELEENIKNLNADKINVEDRMVKTQSGYVYIISNIGSFGENIFKIGVTRRLEPMDRIRELSSASVPFEFDVHALIFAENAFELEYILHQHFKQNQVNKINNRKEFFNVDLSEIKDVVLKEHNGTVHFVTEPEAEQYRETLRIQEKQTLSTN